MGARGPRSRGSRTSALRTVSGPKLVDSKAERARLATARNRIPGRRGRAFFDAVTAEYAGWSAPELELLVRAAQAVARVEQARDLVQEEGLIVDGARGRARHPGVMVERGALDDLRATLRLLRLDEVDRW